MITRIRTTLRHDEGAWAVEYGLLVAAIAAVIVGVVFLLGGKVRARPSTRRTPASPTAVSAADGRP